MVYEIVITTRDIRRMAFALFLVILILIPVLTVFADNNTTNNTNISTNNSTGLLNNTNISIEPMTARASVTVTPSVVNLGTHLPDGAEHSYPGIASVRVTDSGFLIFTTRLYVRASGAFTNTADPASTIPLSNFMYNNPQTGAKTSFTTGDTLIRTWNSILALTLDETVNMNYYLTIPTFTRNGTYTTTITYSVT